jgi:uncharacterized membrane protein AbrB (regulator of aidB expression)
LAKLIRTGLLEPLSDLSWDAAEALFNHAGQRTAQSLQHQFALLLHSLLYTLLAPLIQYILIPRLKFPHTHLLVPLGLKC